MRASQPNSVLVVWRIAELEAQRLNAAQLQPVHFLIALLKIVDLDLPALLPKSLPKRDAVLEELLRDVKKLRCTFDVAKVDVRALRRRLRSDSKCSAPGVSNARLHRSSESKAAFAQAEGLAAATNATLSPLLLLHPMLLGLKATEHELLVTSGLDKMSFMRVAQREAIAAALMAARGNFSHN